MIVCICHRVSDRDIACAVREGCSSFEEVQAELLVATACGACHECARETFHKHAQPAAPAEFSRTALAQHGTARIAVIARGQAAPATAA